MKCQINASLMSDFVTDRSPPADEFHAAKPHLRRARQAATAQSAADEAAGAFANVGIGGGVDRAGGGNTSDSRAAPARHAAASRAAPPRADGSASGIKAYLKALEQAFTRGKWALTENQILGNVLINGSRGKAGKTRPQ